jgi:hypothetical protein
LVAISTFYDWAGHRYGVRNPVARVAVKAGPPGHEVDAYQAAPKAGRDRDVKWLDPGGYRRWRDVGLRGWIRLDVNSRRGAAPARGAIALLLTVSMGRDCD